MKIDSNSWTEVVRHYQDISETLISRALKLNLPGLVIEFEQLPQMTENPQWGGEITELLKKRTEGVI
jgi:methanol--5-hydroxybenzimidazolylcobamide Co-methyltransferase